MVPRTEELLMDAEADRLLSQLQLAAGQVWQVDNVSELPAGGTEVMRHWMPTQGSRTSCGTGPTGSKSLVWLKEVIYVGIQRLVFSRDAEGILPE